VAIGHIYTEKVKNVEHANRAITKQGCGTKPHEKKKIAAPPIRDD